MLGFLVVENDFKIGFDHDYLLDIPILFSTNNYQTNLYSYSQEMSKEDDIEVNITHDRSDNEFC